MAQPRLKKKRAKRQFPDPVQVIFADGTATTLHAPEKIFGDVLQESEEEVLKAMRQLIEMSPDDGKDETAKVTAATKVLDLLADKLTAGRLLARLEPLRHPAVEALREVVTAGKVSSARANAGSYLLKAIRSAAPSVWPPDTALPAWQERMAKANIMCAL
jgi:hypothetical protein